MGEAGRAILAIVASVLGLATLSVILSNQAQTSTVIGAASSGLASVIGAATSPVTGNTNFASTAANALGGTGGY